MKRFVQRLAAVAALVVVNGVSAQAATLDTVEASDPTVTGSFDLTASVQALFPVALSTESDGSIGTVSGTTSIAVGDTFFLDIGDIANAEFSTIFTIDDADENTALDLFFATDFRSENGSVDFLFEAPDGFVGDDAGSFGDLVLLSLVFDAFASGDPLAEIQEIAIDGDSFTGSFMLSSATEAVVIPLPAGMPLLLTALALAGIAARRTRAA